MKKLIDFGYPYLPVMLVRYIKYRRLSKKLGVLNKDGVYVFIW